MKGISQIKQRKGQGRAGLRWKIKLLMSPPPIDKPIVELTEKQIPHIENIEQPKLTLKVPIPESSRIHDKITYISDLAIPQTKSRDDSKFRMVKRKIIQDISREINTDIEESSPFQEGVI